jgi:hypothetical protein
MCGLIRHHFKLGLSHYITGRVVDMNVILHGEGKEIRMHRTDIDQVQHKLVVPTKVFSRKNKWADPVGVDRNLTYKFACQIGDYYHYQLSHVTSKQS